MTAFDERSPMSDRTALVRDRAALLARYRRLRGVSLKIQDRLVGQIPKAVLTAGGECLGLLRPAPNRHGEMTLVLDDEYELSVLMDYCLYHLQQDGQTVVNQALTDAPAPAGSDERRVLQAMQDVRFSLFAVEERVPAIGVHVRDLLRDETLFLVDLGFGESANPGLVLAGNVISLPELSMSTGAMLPVDRAMVEDLVQQLPGRLSIAAAEQFRQLSAAEQAELAGFVMRACLAEGAASQVQARDVQPALRSPGVHWSSEPATRRHPRNAPCPCGSGQKYKRCCGR